MDFEVRLEELRELLAELDDRQRQLAEDRTELAITVKANEERAGVLATLQQEHLGRVEAAREQSAQLDHEERAIAAELEINKNRLSQAKKALAAQRRDENDELRDLEADLALQAKKQKKK